MFNLTRHSTRFIYGYMASDHSDSEWSFSICPMPYNRKQNVLSASLNKSFLFCLMVLTRLLF